MDDDDNINLEELLKSKEPKMPIEQNPPLMPQHPFRLIDAGPSGSGKTTILFNALLKGQLNFQKLYIYAKDLEEEKYTMLIKHYSNIAEEMGVDINTMLVVGSEGEDIVDVNSLDPGLMHLFLFDDFICDRRSMDGKITEHWIRGRKKNASYCFLAQSYYDIPKKIRLNSDYFMLFRFPETKSNQMIISEQKGNLEYDKMKEVFNIATDGDHDWIFIDKKTKDPELKFRKGFKQPLKLT